MVARGGSAGKGAHTSSALAALSSQRFGEVLVWMVAVGLGALALWRVSEAVWGHRYRRGAAWVRGKTTSAALALVYLALGVNPRTTSNLFRRGLLGQRQRLCRRRAVCSGYQPDASS
jgi:hypothetical protein